jgi:hypothetical protein
MGAQDWVARARMLLKLIGSWIDNNDMLYRSYSSSDREVDLEAREEVGAEMMGCGLGLIGSTMILAVSAMRRELGS